MENVLTRNRAVIFGSVGVNRGDDLMNRVLVNACLAAGLRPTVAAIDPDFIERVYEQHSFSSSKKNMYGWMNEIRGADCVIIGGGTIVQNDFNRGKVSGILAYAVMVLLIAKTILRRRVFLIGIGINEVTSINKILAKALRFSDRIVVRDGISVRNSKKIGGLKNIEKAWDIGLCKSLYDPVDYTAYRPSLNSSGYICLSLAKESHQEKALALGRLVIEYAIKNDQAVKLIAMDVRPTEEIELYKVLSSECGESINLEIVAPDTPYEVEALVSGASICVGMRLHFCVICLVNGLSPIVFSREQKSEWIAQFVGEERLIRHDDPCFTDKIRLALQEKEKTQLSESVKEELRQIDLDLKEKLISVISNNGSI